MLLDEIFEKVKRVKKVWVRRDGELKLVKKDAESAEVPQSEKPLFPISKPRYPEKH